MIDNRKIIIIGPPGTGKTTIKKVFFEMGDPTYYVSSHLESTRGVNSSIYSYFDVKLGIFDLAGQENQHWLNNE